MFSSTDESDDGFFWEDIEEHFPPPHVPDTIIYKVDIKVLPQTVLEEERCPYLDLIHPDLLNLDFVSTDGELSSSGAEGILNPGISNLSIVRKVSESQTVKKSRGKKSGHDSETHRSRRHDKKKSKRYLSSSDSEEDEDTDKSKHKSSKTHYKKNYATKEIGNSESSNVDYNEEIFDLRNLIISKAKNSGRKDEAIPGPFRYRDSEDLKYRYRDSEAIQRKILPSRYRDSEDLVEKKKQVQSKSRDSEDLVEKKKQVQSKSRDSEENVKKIPAPSKTRETADLKETHLYKSRDSADLKETHLYKSRDSAECLKIATGVSTSKDSDDLRSKKMPCPPKSKDPEDLKKPPAPSKYRDPANLKETHPSKSKDSTECPKKATGVSTSKDSEDLHGKKMPYPSKSRDSAELIENKIPVLSKNRESEESSIRNIPVISIPRETEDLTETENLTKTDDLTEKIPSLSKSKESVSLKQESFESVHFNEGIYEDTYDNRYDDRYDDGCYDRYDDGFEENSFYCEPCKAPMNSLKSWQAHLSGKRHLKTIKMLDPETAARESVPIKMEAPSSRIPSVPFGYERILTREISKVQTVVDSVEPICPGLDKVMEIIKAENQYSYYCELCDAICVADTIVKHLMSFRHRLQCLKEYDFRRYEMLRHYKRAKAEPEIIIYFQSIEKRHARSQIRVFRDLPLRGSYLSMPGPSTLSQPFQPVSENSMESTLDSKDFNISEETKGNNYHCAVCHCYMNNYAMWLSHIHGKRHLKNMKKNPDELPSKVKFIKSNKPCELLRRLPILDINICGLDFILEKRTEVGYVYDCLLCSSHSNSGDILEHLDGIKHKRKYVEKVNPAKAETIRTVTARMSQNNVNALYEDAAMEEAEKHGIGNPEVFESK